MIGIQKPAETQPNVSANHRNPAETRSKVSANLRNSAETHSEVSANLRNSAETPPNVSANYRNSAETHSKVSANLRNSAETRPFVSAESAETRPDVSANIRKPAETMQKVSANFQTKKAKMNSVSMPEPKMKKSQPKDLKTSESIKELKDPNSVEFTEEKPVTIVHAETLSKISSTEYEPPQTQKGLSFEHFEELERTPILNQEDLVKKFQNPPSITFKTVTELPKFTYSIKTTPVDIDSFFDQFQATTESIPRYAFPKDFVPN